MNQFNLKPISWNHMEYHGKQDNSINNCHSNPSAYQQFERLENGFDGDLSTPFWENRFFHEYNAQRRRRENFYPAIANVTFATGELANGRNDGTSHSGQINNAQIQNAFASAPHRTFSGFKMNKSKSECHKSKDSSDDDNAKRKLTRRYFVSVFAICYAIFLAIFGAIIFISDAVVSQYPLPQSFCIYMLLVAMMYFLYLYIDIRLHVCRAKNGLKGRPHQKNQSGNEYFNHIHFNTDGSTNFKEPTAHDPTHVQTVRKLNFQPLKAIPHKYCFISGRESQSMYLKFGAAWFAFGLLVYLALQICYEVYFIASYGSGHSDCASYVKLSLNVLFSFYTLISLYFIIKYTNVVINVNRNIARIFLMHAIGTSLTMWIYVIIWEAADAIAESDAESLEIGQIANTNETFQNVYHDCGKKHTLRAVHRQFAPYLYPFAIEYCILLFGVWCKIYGNINRCPQNLPNSSGAGIVIQDDQSTKTDSSPGFFSDCTIHDGSLMHDHQIDISYFIHVDCTSSFRGVFVGLLLLISSIVFIILMFVGAENTSYLKTSILLNHIFVCGALVILIIATLLAYIQTMKLDLIVKTAFDMDDILLLIGIPAYFIDSIFLLKPSFNNGAVILICIPIFRVAQVLFQTSFIIDGRRRCSNSSKLQDRKIGRGFVVFLIIANISLWIYNTFSSKSAESYDERFNYYGYRLWNILNHICLPLTMFYRFHSSVCLVEIWNHAYEPH